MEFRSNIIFSVIVHASIAMIILAFAGKNATLSRPENYIAVSLLEYAHEKKSALENKTGNNRDDSKPEMKSQKVSPPDSDRRIVSPANEKVVHTHQYPKNDPLSERKAFQEEQYPYTKSGQAIDKVPEQPVSPQDKPAGPGKGTGDEPAVSSSGIQATMQGNSMEVSMAGSHLTDGGAHSQSLINQIREAIERAKTYPDLARKRRQEGTVVMEFSINPKGLPENIRIAKSSGFSLLDSAARNTIRKAAPFPIVKGNIEVPITFILK